MPFGGSELNQTAIQTRKQIKFFRPRPACGWLWLVRMAVIIFAIAIAPVLAIGLSSGKEFGLRDHRSFFCVDNDSKETVKI